MSLRHDDEPLPTLTPGQQVEALRIAARLQEEEANARAFLDAAQEVGIEPRFLREAVRRLPVESSPPRRNAWALPVLSLATIALFVGQPATGFFVLTTMLFALVPCSNGRSRRYVLQRALLAWSLFDLAVLGIALAEGGPNLSADSPKTLALFLAMQFVTATLGAELARQVDAWRGRVERITLKGAP